MKWKRTGSMVLFITILLQVALTGCQPQQNELQTSESIPKAEPIELSVAFWEIGQAFSLGEDDAVLQKIQKDLNIVFKPINITRSNWTAELQRYASSGGLPDISFHDILGTATYEAWVGQKIIRPIPQDLSKYPLLDSYVNQEYNDRFRREDGNLYAIPRLTYSNEEEWTLDRCIILRKDWMEQLNIPDPQNFSEFQAMLEKFTTMDPDNNGIDDTIGFTAVNMNLFEALYLGIFPELSNIERGWIKEDEQWMPVYNSKKVGDALACAKELYDKSLMDLNFAYQGTAMARSSFTGGQVGAIASQYHSLAEEWKVKNPDIPFTDVAKVMPMWAAPDGNKYRFTTSLHWSETYIGSSVDDKKMDKILELYNYLLSDEAYELVSFGIAGKDWEMVDSERQLLKNDGKLIDLQYVYPSVEIFRQLASWKQEKVYHVSLENTMRYGEDATAYAIGELERQVQTAKRVNYNYDIIFMSTPAKNLLPAHKLIHDYMLKVIVGQRPAQEAWADAIEEIRSKTTLTQAVKEVTARAKKIGL